MKKIFGLTIGALTAIVLGVLAALGALDMKEQNEGVLSNEPSSYSQED